MMTSRILFFIISTFFITQATSTAAVYKGQREYVKECRHCHGGGQGMSTSKNMRTWKKMLKDNGADLAAVHLKSEKAKASREYFSGDRFKKNAKHLRDFLVEYAKDSGKVPACN
ncbi:cytochrome c [Sulfurimonas sp. HSL-1716]|uniref:c-type cytochrome n=1 Tax=Hydrocurvibacter sulfurireducens TaxID=3131937 RepID=UPI0031F9A8E5